MQAGHVRRGLAAAAVACLRDHGLNPPATIDQLKPWMAQQYATDAGRAALHACGFDAHPSDKPPAGSPEKEAADRGGDAAPAPKPNRRARRSFRTSRPRAIASQSAGLC